MTNNDLTEAELTKYFKPILKWTKVREKKLLDLMTSGVSRTDIAKIFDRSVTTIAKKINETGFKYYKKY